MGISSHGGVVSGLGDPHLTNMYGERFDLYQTGKNVLLQIPRWSTGGDALLRLEADATRMGDLCADVYFQMVVISGAWTNTTEEMRFFANGDTLGLPSRMNWARFGKVSLKVVHGKTKEGTDYLNVFAKNLARAGLPVGGLLGIDDHTAASTQPSECTRSFSL